MSSTLMELGLTSGALIKVELGSPHQDGVYLLNICKVALLDDSPVDDILYSKERIFTLTIEPNITAMELK